MKNLYLVILGGAIAFLTPSINAQSLSNFKANQHISTTTDDDRGGNAIEEKEEDGVASGIQSMPTFVSPLDNLVIIPNIEIKGSNTIWNKETGVMNELKLFVASTNLDSTVTNVASRLFIPAASKWGITYTFSKPYIDLGENNNAGAFALVLELNFLGKEFPILDTAGVFSKNTSSPFFQTKIGFEYQFLKDFLTVYAFGNLATVLSNVSEFEEFYRVKNRLFGFMNAGLIGNVFIDSEKKNSFQVDFGGIFQGGDVKRFTKSPDLIIPTVKVGVRLAIFDRMTNATKKQDSESGELEPVKN